MLSFVSVVLVIFDLYVLFLDVETMHNEVPQADDLVNFFRARALQRGRGRGSIETVIAGNPSVPGAGPSASSGKGKKRAREGGNIAITTCSPYTMSTPPPPCSFSINLDSSPPTDDFDKFDRYRRACSRGFEVTPISSRG